MDVPLSQPLVFEPLYRERVWGGRRLEKLFGRELPAGRCIGESWELVDRAEAQSIVRCGPLRGTTLHELWEKRREEIFGRDLPDSERFPIFAKLLDAREKLSLQVHPTADAARALGGEAKTEMWYFAATEAESGIYAGLRRGVERETFEQALRDGRVADKVHRLAVREGDAFFVPSGRLHAIDAGSVLVEIQENSDTTYRVFDWNRRDENGEKRELHLTQSLASIDFQDYEPELVRPNGEELVSCAHFRVEKWDLLEPRAASATAHFALFVCLAGVVEAGGDQFRPGDFFLVSACAAPAMTLQPKAPASCILRVTLPSR